ncbi:MAG: endonuclease Q family protein [Syntrophomonadaceae bacterium]|nr:endonuclease Q family protein [Syntrophomonadaceae bacterium]
MQQIYADLHIHIGNAGGKPVKITASRQLDLKTVLYRDAKTKGLDAIGIIDAACTNVLAEIETMLREGELQELPAGGFLARNGVLLMAGAEIESQEGVHSLIYVPGLEQLKTLHKYLKTRVKNMTLSTQRARVSIGELINLTRLTEGIFCPAHAFTPFKGIYGSWTDKLRPRLGLNTDQIYTLELGLSADTSMADMLKETRSFTYLSNSDAHSSANIAREYNLLRLGAKNFTELKLALLNKAGRKVLANYGMDPLLGKYHRSFCNDCHLIASELPPVNTCHACGYKNMVKGVLDRIAEIRDYEEPHHPAGRPPYYYRVPLRALPGAGPKTIEKLLTYYDNEIEILERADIQIIDKLAGAVVARQIEKMRSGRMTISPGGGGYYGKVTKDSFDC